jgi:hypothetical protein
VLIWLAGADRGLLRQFPLRLRGKYAGIGAAILITGTIAGFSMWFALHTALSLTVAASTVLAAGWALAIMSLDRWLVLSLARRDDWIGWKGQWKYFAWASPRLLLAILFGIVIATPITMEVFNSDINYQLSLFQVAHLAAEEHSPQAQLVKVNVANEQKAVAALVGKEQTGGTVQIPAQVEKEIQYFTTQRNTELPTEKSDLTALNCQLYGGHFQGSNQPCIPGYGPLGKDAQQEYQAAVKQVSYDTSQINALNGQISTDLASQQASGRDQAKEALPAATRQLQADQDEQAELQASFIEANNANTGLFERLSALDAATNDFGRWAARVLIFLLFIVIDCLPVLVKIFQNLAPADPYEQLLDSHETTQLAIANADEDSRLEARQQVEAEAVDVEATILRHKLRQRVDAATGGRYAQRQRGRNWFRRWWSTGPERTIIRQYDPMGPL